MQKTYHTELTFTVSGDNSFQIERRIQDFFEAIQSEGITDISMGNFTQTDGDGVEEQCRLTVDEIIQSCAETKRTISVSEAQEIRKRYNKGCIDNPNCDWRIVVEVLADEIIDNREN